MMPASRATDELAAAIEAQAAWNPFAARTYRAAMAENGYDAWILADDDPQSPLRHGCYAFIRRGRLNTDLTIVSLPRVERDGAFWTSLRALCRAERVTRLEIGSFASPEGTEVPPFGDREVRRSRHEFVLDLSTDPDEVMSPRHRRNARRAAAAGVSVVRTRGAEAASTHQELMQHSLARRAERGEHVPDVHAHERAALLATGSGELFQAVREGVVLSSVLVLRAERGGYSQSAGTSSEGMALGASHFLQREIARQLRAEGALTYGLGGADPNSSLAEFKALFGATAHALPHVQCSLGTRLTRAANGMATLWRDARSAVGVPIQ